MDKAKQGKRSRNRGANAERELSKLLQEYGYPVKRGMVFYGQSDVVGLDGIHIECKRVEKLNIWSAIEQSREEAKKKGDGEPVVMFRRNREKWLVCLDLDLFMRMYKEWNNGGKEDVCTSSSGQ